MIVGWRATKPRLASDAVASIKLSFNVFTFAPRSVCFCGVFSEGFILWEYVTHQLIGNKFMKGEQQFEVRHFFDVPENWAYMLIVKTDRRCRIASPILARMREARRSSYSSLKNHLANPTPPVLVERGNWAGRRR